MTRSNLRLLTFPVADQALRRDVEAALRRRGDGSWDRQGRAEVEDDLRRWYPALTIHERDDLGGYPDDPTTVWYIYRDGRVRRPNAVRDRLYDALATARTTREISADRVADARRTSIVAGFGETEAPTEPLEPAGRGRPRS